MNRIKCKINLWRLSKQPAIPQHILLHLLQPYIVPYELQLTDDRIYFSKPLTLKQNVELFLRYSGFFVKNGLPYQDILFIKNMPDSDGIHLYTRTGHVFHFWREGRNWEITNCLRYNEPLFSMRKRYAWGALWKKKFRKKFRPRLSTLREEAQKDLQEDDLIRLATGRLNLQEDSRR